MTPQAPTRVCVIGNSHVAALKGGWESIKETVSQARLTFFASHSNTLEALEADGACLVTKDRGVAASLKRTSGGASRIDPRDFDIFWIHGLRFELRALDQRLSAAVVDATCHDSFALSHNGKLARMLRKLSRAPIFVTHCPLRVSARDLDFRRSQHIPYLEAIDRIATIFADEKLIFGAQPAATIAPDGWSTRSNYTRSAVNLRGGDAPKDNRSHMNSAFGREWLISFLSSFNLKYNSFHSAEHDQLSNHADILRG
jgi:hypothetical protein